MNRAPSFADAPVAELDDVDQPAEATPLPGDPRVLVVVGTDYHPFDRVVSWTDTWLSAQPGEIRVVVQHGSSAAPRRAEGHALLPHTELQRLMGVANVVVTHGGPATIMEVRRLGKWPVVVPRNPALGEHVDEHQQLFARRMAAANQVLLCETQDELAAALSAAELEPDAFRLATADTANADGAPHGSAVARLGDILDELIATSPRRALRPQARGLTSAGTRSLVVTLVALLRR